MNYKTIEMLQKEYGYYEAQQMINSGNAWSMEGSYGRNTMSLLECGACMLPLERKQDYYGNTIPSRADLKAGTKGTYQNCLNFWEKVQSGEYYLEHETESL